MRYIKKTKTIVGVMAASLTMMCYLTPNSVLADISKSFPDVPLQYIQMLTSMPCLIGVFVCIITGKLATWICKKNMIVFGACMYLVGGVLPYFFHESIGQMFLGTVLLGVGAGIMMACNAAIIYDCFGETESGRLMGIQSAFVSAGGLIFIWLGGRLGAEKWENAFLSYLLVIVCMVIMIICLPKGELEKRLDDTSLEIYQSKSTAEKTGVPSGVWFYSITGFVVFLCVAVFNSNISVVVELRQLGGVLESSHASMCYTLAGMLVGCIVGFLLERIKSIFIIITAMGCAGMLIAYFGDSLGALYIGGMFCGATFSGFTPSGNHYVALQANRSNRALCIAIFTSVVTLGMAVSPVVVAWLLGRFSIEHRFLGAGIAFAALMMVFILKREKEILQNKRLKK